MKVAVFAGGKLINYSAGASQSNHISTSIFIFILLVERFNAKAGHLSVNPFRPSLQDSTSLVSITTGKWRVLNFCFRSLADVQKKAIHQGDGPDGDLVTWEVYQNIWPIYEPSRCSLYLKIKLFEGMGQTDKIIIGVTVGVAVGIVLSCCAFFVVRFCRKRASASLSSRELNTASLPIRANGIDSSIDSSASLSIGYDPEDVPHKSNYWGHRKHQERDIFSSYSGIPRYLYKDIQKATQNFTTILGQGSFGPVYKATLPTGAIVAVKVLANKSKQGEKEFQTEVVLLSRLHHRNLVNLVGYCVDKGQLILVYEFMSNGSLASLLYGTGPPVLNWEERLQIALDVSHGIEYLHDGASPSVIHRDLKSANILLDRMMRAKVADFGLSKEEMFDGRRSGLKGTYGYMDPSYMSTNKFTKQSDVYSFGIILFELITAINPQQGLMEYINLAVIGGGDGRAEWDEIADKRLIGSSNMEEIRVLASIAHRCLHKNPSRRPAISDITQAISGIRQRHSTRAHTMSISETDPSGVFSRIAQQQIELNGLGNIK